MSKKITIAEMAELAKEFGLLLSHVRTVASVEAAGSGFEENGDLKIQFEPYEFKKRTGHVIPNGVEGPRKEWLAYYAAKAVNWVEALNSTSWGMGQIMGYNCKLAGYATVADMINDFKTGEKAQIRGMLTFIKNSGLIPLLLKQDWAAFARRYNGPKYAVNQYDIKLAAAFKRYSK